VKRTTTTPVADISKTRGTPHRAGEYRCNWTRPRQRLVCPDGSSKQCFDASFQFTNQTDKGAHQLALTNSSLPLRTLFVNAMPGREQDAELLTAQT